MSKLIEVDEKIHNNYVKEMQSYIDNIIENLDYEISKLESRKEQLFDLKIKVPKILDCGIKIIKESKDE